MIPRHVSNLSASLRETALRQLAEGKKACYEALFSLERDLRQRGYALIAGVDEAGRGPLAGPVVAAAVIFPEKVELPSLRDSKLLRAPQREYLAEQICACALAWAVGLASVEEIDALNIRRASFLAMRRALAGLHLQPDHVVVDGEAIPGLTLPQTGMPRADARVAAVAAASIIAKVTRDRLMVEIDRQFPQYGFARHKGYPTREHLAALAKYGPTPLHRRSFSPVKYLLAKREQENA